MKSTLRRKPLGARSRIDTTTSPFFQVLVLTNLTGKPFHERFGRRLHISLTEWRVMMAVADRPGITAQQLSEYTGLDKMSVSRAVNALAGRGRLARETSPADGRRLHLSLTAAGRAIYRRIARSAGEREREVYSALSAAERKSFVKLLRKLVARARGIA